MKKLLFAIALTICVGLSAQVYPKIKPISKGYMATYVVTGAQLAAGNPLTILPGRGGNLSIILEEINFEFREGSTLISGTGTDSTLVYMTIDGTKANLVKIEDEFFEQDNEWNLPVSGPTKVNTAIVFDPAGHLTGGTGANLIITIYYKIKTKTILP